ncbi:hypothetical protein BC008_22575 [Mastigocoleus testarum BC008]|uniref:Uncharacterized protein n=1 Tax=Mastigocoleus testarum BC008 TaxID=371196 RepID=A0A0V7ZNE8_9CYAN|nr:hypothetical protein BC008_22575 [Mastigocoleus testarum BC008]
MELGIVETSTVSFLPWGRLGGSLYTLGKLRRGLCDFGRLEGSLYTLGKLRRGLCDFGRLGESLYTLGKLRRGLGHFENKRAPAIPNTYMLLVAARSTYG